MKLNHSNLETLKSIVSDPFLTRSERAEKLFLSPHAIDRRLKVLYRIFDIPGHQGGRTPVKRYLLYHAARRLL